MTGYGIVQAETEYYTLQAELKTLNSKFLDLTLRLPKELTAFEYQFREILSKGLVRGKANVTLELTPKEGMQGAVFNQEIFNKLFEELKNLAKGRGVSESDVFNSVMRQPEILQQSDNTTEVVEQSVALNLVKQVVAACNDFRVQEGNSLEEALRESVNAISKRLEEIKNIEPERTAAMRKRLTDSILEQSESEKIDENRFEQELIYYIEKLDINEELVRLKNHLMYFIETLEMPDSQGKKLGFIGQEMGREINTIGSKANDATIQRLVVEMKDELEKIKEQVLNVL